MRKHRVFWLVLLLLFSATHGRAENKVDDKFLSDTTAGQEVKVAGTFEGEGTWHASMVYLGPPEMKLPALLAKVSDDKKSLSFTLPTDLKDGRYSVTLTLEGDAGTISTLAVPGELRIPSPPELQVAVTAVHPVSPYPNPQHANKYDFEIAGTNFASTLANNHVEIDGLPIALALAPCSKDYKTPCLSAEPGSETRKLIVEGYSPPAYSRPLGVGVRVGNGKNVAKAPESLVFSSISKTRLEIYAVGAFALLLGIVFALVQAGVRLGKIDGEKYGSLHAFLIDKESNSYSLSKFQLTLFTLVTVFGYIYVFVCQLFVQWKFELPPVPEGLPGMMAVSLGTTVVAAGIGSKIGGKGAGPTSPSPADFITSGGIVLPERFQFFLWTIVSSVGVLVLILASDPVTLTQLPKLPDGMLYLMGLSSAGYLGGKLARGPGPTIKSINAQVSGTNLEATLTGDNLSSDATFQLDDERIPADQVTVLDKTLEGQDSKLCSMLKIQLKNVAARFFDGSHVLRIINPDTQGADVKYGATIDSVGPITAGDADIPVSVKGTNFKDPSSAEWTDAAGATTPIPVAGVTKKSDTELEVTLKPGGAGKGKLSIKSPGGLTTTVEVTVVAP